MNEILVSLDRRFRVMEQGEQCKLQALVCGKYRTTLHGSVSGPAAREVVTHWLKVQVEMRQRSGKMHSIRVHNCRGVSEEWI